MSHKLEIEMRFSLLSGVHVTGEQGKLWTDKTLVVDWFEGRRPVVPATTVKGWLRESAERLLRGLGVNACDGSTAQTICGTCVVCGIFGSPRRRSPLRFQDAVLSDAATDVRMNVSLSRHRKTSYEERLFSTEVAWQRILQAKVSGFFASVDDAKKATALLYFAAKAGFAIGAARSRGLGWLRLEEFEARLDGAVLSHEELGNVMKSHVLQAEVIR